MVVSRGCGFIKSIVINGVTYTSDNAGHISESGATPAGYQDHGSWIVVPTVLGGALPSISPRPTATKPVTGRMRRQRQLPAAGLDRRFRLYARRSRWRHGLGTFSHRRPRASGRIQSASHRNGHQFQHRRSRQHDLYVGPAFRRCIPQSFIRSFRANSLTIPVPGASAVSRHTAGDRRQHQPDQGYRSLPRDRTETIRQPRRPPTQFQMQCTVSAATIN